MPYLANADTSFLDTLFRLRDGAPVELRRTVDDEAPSSSAPVEQRGQAVSYLDAIIGAGGGVATALATTDAPVDLASGEPGHAGDVLTLVDPTHSQWKPPTGGGDTGDGGDEGGVDGPFVATADETISALRVVRVVAGVDGHVVLARPPEVAARVPLGIAITATQAGGEVTIVDRGELTDQSWNWTPGLYVLLGANGQLVQSAPSSGFVVAIGVALTAKTIAIRINAAITLAVD